GRNADTLQQLILAKSRELTASDAGSLYLVEEDAGGGRHLRFQLAQNDSLPTDYERATMPLTEASLAGYTALSGRVLRLDDVDAPPAGGPPPLNPTLAPTTGDPTRPPALRSVRQP